MNISSAQTSQVAAIRLHGAAATELKPRGRVCKSDQLVMSEAAKAVQEVKQYMSALPDFRSQKVEELRKMISDGSYRVSDRDLASAILQGGEGGEG